MSWPASSTSFQRGPERRAAQAARKWERLAFREINGSRWLVIGFGAIGQGVADRARPFGAHDHRRPPQPGSRTPPPTGSPPWPTCRPCCPRPMSWCSAARSPPRPAISANAAFFSAMKPGSVLVNVGRGGLVDEPALLSALDKGVPGHAVLDVFETEPLPEDSPFWGHPRVSLTAHASGITSGQDARNDELFIENLRRYVAGEALLNVAAPADVLAG
jgi:phosphoglycerate dehydrogenase-like enzyme